MKRRIISLLALCAMLLTLCACGGDTVSSNPPATDTPPASQGVEPSETLEGPSADIPSLPTVDPSGASIDLPEHIDSIVVLAPSIAETVVALGLGDKIVGYDLNSVGLAGLPENAPTFDTVNPDVERLAALAPDVLLVSSLSLYDQEAPYQPLIDAGVCVICVPTSGSIDGVKSDIRFLAAALSAYEAGQVLLDELNAELDELAATAASIPAGEHKSVYFEISAASWLSLFCSAVMNLLAAASPTYTQRIQLWQLGSFSMREWSAVWVLTPFAVLGLLLFLSHARELDVMSFGEEQARVIGVDLAWTKRVLLTAVAALTGAAVAFVGIIGFVDLIAPHIVRKWFGAAHRRVLPAAALLGGTFLMLCDLAARTLTPPHEIPIGSITALLGAPFFLYVFFVGRKKRRDNIR